MLELEIEREKLERAVNKSKGDVAPDDCSSGGGAGKGENELDGDGVGDVW
jgi:hypothetical protein